MPIALGVGMRRFELVEGTSSKFWAVEVADAEMTVVYGRIGTAGQTKTKSFASATAAQAEAAKLIREKTGKGYSEVTDGAHTAPAPVAKPKAPAAPTAKPSIEPPAQTPPPSVAPKAAPQPPQPDTPAAIDVPQGGFQWTDGLVDQLPVVRGVHVPPLPNPAGALSVAPRFNSGKDDFIGHRLGWLVQAGTLTAQPALWTTAEGKERTQRHWLDRKDPDVWAQLLEQCALYAHAQKPHLRWALQSAVALHGLAFALEALLSLSFPLHELPGAWFPRDGDDVHALRFMRHAVAAADEADYHAAVAVADSHRGQSAPLDEVIAYLFPEQAAWTAECIEHSQTRDDGYWLSHCVMSPEVALRYWQRQSLYTMVFTPAALLLARLHGEAAFPVLVLALDAVSGKDETQAVLKLLLRMRVPELLPALIARMEDKEVRAVLDRLAEQWPAAALVAAIGKAVTGRLRTVESWAVRLALRVPTVVEPALAACSAAERERFTSLLSELSTPEEAAMEALPDLLREPPWVQGKRPPAVPTVALDAIDVQPTVAWPEGLRAPWSAYTPGGWMTQRTGGKPEAILSELAIRKPAHARVLAGEPPQPEDIERRQYQYLYVDLLLLLPQAPTLAVWNTLSPGAWDAWSIAEPLRALMAKYELAALPGLLHYAASNAEVGLEVALPFDAPGFATVSAHALKNLKKAKPLAMQWLTAHAETALLTLTPQALGKDRVPRENAQVAIRWLAQNGYEALAREVATRYGQEAVAAMDALLSADPLLIVPARMPKLPTFFVPAAFRRPLLANGQALPVTTVEHIGSMLAISRPGEPYPGLEVVKSACRADSLAEFAWDVFEAWMGAGAPSKEGWAFQVLGWFGDDETARRLAPKIREWPGEAAHARAVAGLDILSTIGTDVALMHLNGIASKVKFKGLQEKAKEKIAAVAEARGLTAVELADRLVPDLGLDASGRTALDFGPRQFYVGFDEALKPFVRDADGARLKDLPKPNKSDDAALSAAAVERYKGIKKDAKAIASLQVVRLELAMCARRRWSATDFRLFFLDHPLMRHLACRLVWGVYQEGELVDAFRVAEDLSLADREDSEYTLADDAEVGIAHVLEMPAELQADFGQVFADYEILQPFRQLGRETYTLSDEERRTGVITRFKDKHVATGSIMGLINRGWERGEAQDGGWVGWFNKPLPGRLEVELQLDPGTVVGDISYEPKQRIPEIGVRRAGTWDNSGKVSLAGLDPILVSEFIRDADLLTPL